MTDIHIHMYRDAGVRFVLRARKYFGVGRSAVGSPLFPHCVQRNVLYIGLETASDYSANRFSMRERRYIRWTMGINLIKIRNSEKLERERERELVLITSSILILAVQLPEWELQVSDEPRC